MKFGVADYGMNIRDGGRYDTEQRLIDLQDVGYHGIERLTASSPAEALHMAGIFRRLGTDFSTCLGPSIENSIQWTAALGKDYVWDTCGANRRDTDFDDFCRRVNTQVRHCQRWGIRVGLHNHLGQRIENQEELENVLKQCPDMGLVFDTGHLSAAGGDPIEIVEKYHERICVMHIKDVHIKDESIGLDQWEQRLRFCELGAGTTDLDNAAVLQALVKVGYHGWVHVEHDTHLQEPLIDLKTSMDFIQAALA